MADTAEKPATYADLEAVPPHLVAEILFGRLVTHPRPARRHGGAAGALNALLTNSYQFGSDGPGGWIFIPEPELHLGPHIAVPDIAGWRRERMTEPADRAWFEVAPDWVCEILSPRTEKYDKGQKRSIYAEYGVEHLWHVDPRAKSLEVFTRQNENWLLIHTFFDEENVTAPPFTALTFSLGLLWPFDTQHDAKA
jgi:Uma2 family endonuclease